MSAVAEADWRGLLLRQLSLAETQRLECLLLADPAALAALRDAETDLHDDAARLQLTAAEQAAFDRHLLNTADGQARQRFSQAMKPQPQEARHGHRYTPLARPRSRYGLRMALTGVAIAVGLALVLGVFRRDLLTGVSRHLHATASPAAVAAEPTLLLLATGAAGAARPAVNVVLRTGASGLRVQAEVTHAEEARLYRIRLFDDADPSTALFEAGDLPLQTLNGYRFVETLLPASALAGGARRLQVEALPPAGAFSDRWLIRARTTDAPPIALPDTQPGR